jgi:hypothetical protein
MLMNLLSQRVAVLVLLAAVAGCSTIKDAKDTVGGWVSGGSNTLDTSKKVASSNSGPLLKYAATLRVSKYVDQRKTSNPRYLGVLKGRVTGMSGDEILMDQDVAAIVQNSIAKRFDTEGYQIVEGGAPALFEVSGVVKALTLNVKDRDDILITIETTLKEIATGKVVWSGSVTEKNDRFAGVSGNNKDDVVSYLNKELRIASTKTVEAISASLMASRPDLFNLTPGTKPVPGVTVFVAPQLPKTAAPVVQQIAQPVSEAPSSNYKAHASETAGLLLVNTSPSRARVYLDGVYYGMSPLRLEMEPGIHAISVKLAGYNMVTEKVSVRRGDNTEIELNLEH